MKNNDVKTLAFRKLRKRLPDLLTCFYTIYGPRALFLVVSKTKFDVLLSRFDKVILTLPACSPVMALSRCEDTVAILNNHSIEALSLLLVVARTIGLITPFALTLMHAVLPLFIALLRAGISSSLLVTSSP